MVKNLQTKMLLLLGLLFVGAGMTWADEYISNLTFEAACNGHGVADDGVKWMITTDGATESNFSETQGVHFEGVNGGKFSYVQLSTKSINEGTIKSIAVEASGQESPTISVTVGGEPFGQNQTATSSDATYTFSEENPANAGEIVVTIEKQKHGQTATDNKELYVKSIVVVYEAPADPKLSFGETTYFTVELGGSFTAPTLSTVPGFDGTITYKSSNPHVAEVTNTGEVTLGHTAGIATITASFTANEKWRSSTASYIIALNDPNHPMTTINFGSNAVKIEALEVTGKDSEKNEWTITSVFGSNKPAFTNYVGYSQIGDVDKNKPVNRITFTTTLSSEFPTYDITAFTATFAGTAGNITLKVGDTTVGEGELDGQDKEVRVTASGEATGNTLTVIIENITGNVKCYSIGYLAVASVEITMNQYGLMSYAFDKDLDFTGSGLKAYAVTGINGNELTMTQVTAAKAGEGLMLEGEAGSHTILLATTEPAAVTGNMLVGLTQATEVPQVHEDDYTTFILAYVEGEGVNWYKLSEDSYILKANSAYLKLSAEQVEGLGNESRGLTMVYGDPSGIENVNRPAVNNNQYFDLSGRRVAQPTKGLYIVNGKKVYIK